MLPRSLVALILSSSVGAAQFANPAAPKSPKELRAPKGQILLLRLHAKGEQVYVCQVASDGARAPSWKFKAPKADLFGESAERVGRHFAGPTWEANDGSQVVGKLVVSVPSQDVDSIPWLLLAEVSRSEKGMFSRVESIQRLDTKGGTAPKTSCTLKEETGVAYEAEYYLWPADGRRNQLPLRAL